MSLSTIKGKVLEYTVRRILLKCGFTPVKPDGLFIYDSGHLQYINGKGARHDADVLMNPPIQMPFGYPARLLFECKAYSGNLGLPIIRNASGLREDINAFEIVTEDFLRARKNNSRSTLAIHERKRHVYQVGVASIQAFSKPALEFAANNKIPLFSLQQTFPATRIGALINSIPETFVSDLGDERYAALVNLLSTKNHPNPRAIEEMSAPVPELAALFKALHANLERVHIGMLESGDLIFLTADEPYDSERDVFNRFRRLSQLETFGPANLLPPVQLHWYARKSDLWTLSLRDDLPSYKFYLPRAIVVEWEKSNRSKESALEMKSESFSRIFVFRQTREPQELPFVVLTIDRNWLREATTSLG